MSKGTNRRNFIKYTAATGMGFWVAARKSAAEDALDSKSPNERLNVACIGIGGKGDSDSEQVSKHANVLAVCDVDDKRLDKKIHSEVKAKDGSATRPFENAKRYNDFRKLFLLIPPAGKNVFCGASAVLRLSRSRECIVLMRASLCRNVIQSRQQDHQVPDQ